MTNDDARINSLQETMWLGAEVLGSERLKQLADILEELTRYLKRGKFKEYIDVFVKLGLDQPVAERVIDAGFLAPEAFDGVLAEDLVDAGFTALESEDILAKLDKALR